VSVLCLVLSLVAADNDGRTYRYGSFEDYFGNLALRNSLSEHHAKSHENLFRILEANEFSNHQFIQTLGDIIREQYFFGNNQTSKTFPGDDSTVRYSSQDSEPADDSPLVDVLSAISNGPSMQCVLDFMAFANAAKNLNTTWALYMLDSFGRPSPGVLEGRVFWTGYYYECTNVKAGYMDNSGQGHRFQGRYCSAHLKLDLSTPSLPGLKFPVQAWGLCVPDSCETSDVALLINMAISQAKLSQHVQLTGGTCHKPLELAPRAIAVTTIVSLILFLVVIATIVDLVMIQRPKWEEERYQADIGQVQAADLGKGEVASSAQSQTQLVTMEPLTFGTGHTSGRWMKLLLSFSAWSNSMKIWNTRQPAGTIKCLNGIRVISISWVILGHCLVVLQMVTENVTQTGKVHVNRWTFQAIYNATFSVDSFFVLSGLLLTYLTLSEMRKRNGQIKWWLFYVHRYLRLTPIYMMCLAIWAGTMPYWYDGPLWKQEGYEKNYCKESWWANLLYIQNLIKWGDKATQNGCFAWAWYLAVDMQFYVISPLILIPLYKKPKLGITIIAILFIATTVTPFVLVMDRHYGVLGQPAAGYNATDGDANYDIYIAPYSRMGPYLIGMFVGYILYINNCRMKISRPVNLICWSVATGLALAVIYGCHRYADGTVKIPLLLSAFYNSMSRSTWGACVAWVILACATGNGGLVDSLLSLPVWVPLSRLTYAAYLIHPMIQGGYGMSRATPFYIDDMNYILVFLAFLVAVYACSFIVSLVLEAPVMGIEKVLFNKEKRS